MLRDVSRQIRTGMPILTVLTALGLLLAIDVCPAFAQATDVKPVDLRCEYLTKPLTIDTTSPRLSWNIESSRRGERQSAYHVLVASTPELLAKDQGDIWDSGKVASDQCFHIEYAGQPLASRMSCYWKVRVWDAQGNPSAWSEPAAWTMGLLKAEDWKAKWIAAPNDANLRGAILFRREATIPSGVKRAIVRVCGLGHHELFVNGVKVGDRVLDPAWTNYQKSCQYVTDDITDLLKPGANTLAVMLGNGMYNLAGSRNVKFTPKLFGPPKLILQVDMILADGSSLQIVTDNTWKLAAGPITATFAYGGEEYDARREPTGWMQPGYDDSHWTPAAEVDGPGGHLVSQKVPPLKVMQVLKPIAVAEPRPGVLVYDFGQNISGWPQITVRGSAGAVVKLFPEEMLDPQGTVSQRFGICYYAYTLKGAGDETWHPQFSYYGFRYLQVEGAARDATAADGKPVLLAIEAHWVHGSARPAGEFSCSDALLNQIHRLVDAAVRSNMQSLFTDCPHREKLGWLATVSSMAFSRMYNYDVPTIYAKVVDDMHEAQTDAGLIPDIAPEYTVFDGPFRDSPTWGSDFIVVPWYMYQQYRDSRVLSDHYSAMCHYMEYLGSKSQGNLLPHGLGDWADIGPKAPYSHTPVPLVESAQYYFNAKVMAQVANVLGKTEDAARFQELAANIATAFTNAFFHRDRNTYGDNTQTGNAMPLSLGMVEPDRQQAIMNSLIDDIRARGNQITGGCCGYRWVLRSLADHGRSDVFHDVIQCTDRPGYGYQIKQGATALTESWDARKDVSWNHDMLGQVEEWFYHDLAGIQIDLSGTGSQRLQIKPAIVGDIAWVKAHHDSILGRIVSNWSRTGDQLTMDVTIPANATALVYVPTSDPTSVQEAGKPATEAPCVKLLRREPDMAVFEVGSGCYQFTAKLTTNSTAGTPVPQKISPPLPPGDG